MTFWTLTWFVTEPGLVVFAKRGLESHGPSMAWVPLLVLLFSQFACSTVLGVVVSWPKLTSDDVKRATMPELLNALNFAAQATQMGALMFGSLSFTQMIRAMEPIFLLFWSIVLVGLASTPITIYVASIPIYAGAVLCSSTELNFHWATLALGLSSNLLLTGRNAIAKSRMAGDRPISSEEAPPTISTPLDRESNAVAALTLFQMSALPALICGLVTLGFVAFSGLPVANLLVDKSFILSGMLFAVMRHSSTMLLQVFSLLVHSLVKLSRRFFFIFLALWMAHQKPSAWHVTGLMLVLCGASGMDVCSRFPR